MTVTVFLSFHLQLDYGTACRLILLPLIIKYETLATFTYNIDNYSYNYARHALYRGLYIIYYILIIIGQKEDKVL